MAMKQKKEEEAEPPKSKTSSSSAIYIVVIVAIVGLAIAALLWRQRINRRAQQAAAQRAEAQLAAGPNSYANVTNDPDAFIANFSKQKQQRKLTEQFNRFQTTMGRGVTS